MSRMQAIITLLALAASASSFPMAEFGHWTPLIPKYSLHNFQGHGFQGYGFQGHQGLQRFDLQTQASEEDESGDYGDGFETSGRGFGGYEEHDTAYPVRVHSEVETPQVVPVYKHVAVPVHKTIEVKVPHPILVPVPKPYPIEIPVNKPVAVPVVKEITIQVEKVVPYPVEKKVPYPVEKKVPYKVEKHVTVHVDKPYPVKVPYIKTIIHEAKGGHGGWH